MPPDKELRRDEILEAAFAAAPDNRTAIAKAECAGDDELFSEVAGMIAAHDQMGACFLEPAHPSRAQTGWTIERYRIERLIGRGGMSSVYRARDLEIDRNVALKMLTVADGEAGDLRKLFLSEVRALGRVSHPGVVQVYDCGEFDGCPFLVMELLEGEDLSHAIREDRCGPFENRIRIAREIAIALSYIHRLGILHRDIKPSNVFLEVDGGVKLMDFGISRPVDALTQSNVFAGTLQYMAPEQVQGLAGTPASEVYSWGILLYEMFTRQTPSAGGSIADVLRTTLHEELPVEQLHEACVPNGIVQLLKDATAKDPRRRLQTFDEVIYRLDNPRAANSTGLRIRSRLLRWAGATAAVTVSGVVWFALSRAPVPRTHISQPLKVENANRKIRSGSHRSRAHAVPTYWSAGHSPGQKRSGKRGAADGPPAGKGSASVEYF